MLDRVHADRGGPAIEIGCGTGIFSRALARSGAFPGCLITDASLDFVRRARGYVLKPFAGLPSVDERQVRFGLLMEDGMRALPESSFSLVSLRYVLHHILDWPAFIGESARLLRAGGVLTFEEPCLEGFMVQALLASFVGRRVMSDGVLVTGARQSGLRYRLGRLRRFLGVRTRAESAAAHGQPGPLWRAVVTSPAAHRRSRHRPDPRGARMSLRNRSLPARAQAFGRPNSSSTPLG